MNKDSYPRPASFAQAVRMMREAQKRYFATRTRSALDESKHYEKWVDEYLTIHPEPEQRGLFAQDPTQAGLFEKKPEDQ